MTAMNSEDLLAKLIGFDTTSRSSNMQLIDFVRNLLDDHNIASTLVPNEDGSCANLYATIGPDDVGGIMLSGHTDVVPTTGQAWNSDPYQMKTGESALFGRGACDMKGFIASVLAGLPAMAAQRLQTPIHLAFSYDEEIGCVGAKKLVAAMRGFEVKPKLGLIGEPTNMAMVLGHKGKIAFSVTISGLSCHSAYITNGVNTVEYAAELIAFISKMNAQVQQRYALDTNYSVPHSTFHVGNIRGGTSLNIVPSECVFEFEIRNLPEQDLTDLVHEIKHYAEDVLLVEMKARFELSSIKFKELAHYPGLKTDPASAIIHYTRSINPIDKIGDNVSFGTEAGLFNEIGINSVVCGPGSIDQAHKPDEFVNRQQMQLCDQMIKNLVHSCSQPSES